MNWEVIFNKEPAGWHKWKKFSFGRWNGVVITKEALEKIRPCDMKKVLGLYVLEQSDNRYSGKSTRIFHRVRAHKKHWRQACFIWEKNLNLDEDTCLYIEYALTHAFHACGIALENKQMGLPEGDMAARGKVAMEFLNDALLQPSSPVLDILGFQGAQDREAIKLVNRMINTTIQNFAKKVS